MSEQAELFERAKQVKMAYQETLLQKANVVGVGIGYAQRSQQATNEICLVVMVSQKLPDEALPPDDRIPRELEGVPVDVQQVGDLRAMD